MQPGNSTLSIGERAAELMRKYCSTASPRSYELWFCFATGSHPALNEAVKALAARGTKLTDEDIETLSAAYMTNGRREIERAGAGMLAEIEDVVGFIDSALSSAARYDASLTALTADLAEPTSGQGLRDILESLVIATREVAATNRTLETRLRDSRGEIESLRETLDSVRTESLIDPLTGIANRKHFEETLAAAVSRAHEGGEPLSLVVIDIDNFKSFNDLYGHLTGDQVLRLVSSAMHDHVQQGATLARFGGEEFAMVLPGTDRNVAFACAETVRRSVEGRELLKRSTGESLGRITISLGVGVLEPGETATSLLERADGCMYGAKRAGRNRTVADGELDAEFSRDRAA